MLVLLHYLLSGGEHQCFFGGIELRICIHNRLQAVSHIIKRLVAERFEPLDNVAEFGEALYVTSQVKSHMRGIFGGTNNAVELK